MSKVTIDEQTINKLIQECINEELEEGGAISNWLQKQKQKVKDAGGLVNYAAGGLGYGLSSLGQKYNQAKQAYKAGRTASRVDAARKKHPLEYYKDKYGDDFSKDVDAVTGRDSMGKSKFARLQYIKALRAYGNSDEQINQILSISGYEPLKGNEASDTSTKMPSNGAQPNPDAVRASKENVSEDINELGETGWGRKNLNRLGEKRRKQSYEEKKKADVALNSAEEAEHSNKSKDYMGRSMAAFAKASEGGKKINEVGDTLKGQYMLGRLDANRMKKAKDLKEPIHTLQKQHDFEKSDELRKKQNDLYDRSNHAFMKAHDERLSNPTPMLHSNPKGKMMKMSNDVGQDIEKLRLNLQNIKKKNADRKNGAQEELNEVGDTKKGQKQLGRLSARRIIQSWEYNNSGDEKKADEYGKRNKDAKEKARKERENVVSPNKKSKMRNAFYKAERDEIDKPKKARH